MRLALAWILITATVAAVAQTASFEVASIKLNTSGLASSRTSSRDNGFVATNTTVKFLIISAFNLKDFQLSGGPTWVASDRYDVNARVREGAKYTREMLRTLLEERFKLVTHRESRDDAIYSLVVAHADGRLGPRLKPTATLDCTPGRGANPGGPLTSPCSFNSSIGDVTGKMSAVGQGLEALAALLGNFGLGRLVVDRTGLTGRYDFELQWSYDALRPNADAAGEPGLFTALQEQLGLKLETARGPVEFVVIDSIERPRPD